MNRENVILIHAASFGGPLLPLADLLSGTHRVVRIGLQPSARLPALELGAVLDEGSGTHLVAHGHAAHAALRLALSRPGRIASMALIEPMQPHHAAGAVNPGILDQPVCLIGRILSGLQVHLAMRHLRDALAHAEQHFLVDAAGGLRENDMAVAELAMAFILRHSGYADAGISALQRPESRIAA